jgi:NADH dehydrogenase
MASSDPTKVLILGAGFAGKAAADALCDRLSKSSSAKVTLIDRRNFQLFTPMLYQAATGLVDPEHIASPIRKDAKKRGYEFVKATVESINLAHRLVVTDAGNFDYDYLVIALGSVPANDRIRGAKERSIPLKTGDDSEKIHNRILASLEAAANLPHGDPRRKGLLTFVVMGGSTGSELAGSLQDYLRLVCDYYPTIELNDCKVIIVERKERLFPGGDKSLSEVVKKALEGRGVEVILNVEVKQLKPGGLELSDGRSIEAENIFWDAGTKPSPILDNLSESMVRKHMHRIVVDEYLRIPVFSNVYVIGDDAAIEQRREEKDEEEEHHHDGESHSKDESKSEGHDGDAEKKERPSYVPPTAEAALEEGKYVGRLIAHMIKKSDDTADVRPFVFKEKGTMLSLGHRYGIVKFKHLTLKGFLGWLTWRVVHVALLSSGSGRFNVVVDWTLGSFKERNIAELGELPPLATAGGHDDKPKGKEQEEKEGTASHTQTG